MYTFKQVLSNRNALVKGSIGAGVATTLALAGTVGVQAATGVSYGGGYGTQPPGSVAIYRALNTANGDHLFTASLAEKNNAVTQYKYNDETYAFTAFSSANTNSGVSPVYRLVSKRTGDHFYTADFSEAVNAASYGYVQEGIAFSAWKSQFDAGTGVPVVAVDRLLKDKNGDHLYTIAPAESASAVSFGYHGEGTAFYLQNQ